MAGTCWGCLVVAETSGLSPVTVFRPYTEEIQSLLCFCPAPGIQALVSIGRPTPPPIPDHSQSAIGTSDFDAQVSGKKSW